MSEKQKYALYAVTITIVFMVLLRPLDNFQWDDAKQLVALLFCAAAVGGIIWRLKGKKSY